jgi:hypothetical protein
MICAIIDGSDVFRAKLRFRVFLIREFSKGTRGAPECNSTGEFFQQTVHAESLSAQSVRFWTVLSVPEQQKPLSHLPQQF